MVKIRNHNVVIDAEFTNKLHPKVLYELGKMCPDSQYKFQEIYAKQKRSLIIAYICLIFFPGTHYAFLGRWQMQILFWLTLGGGLLWWMVDLFRLSSLVQQTNFHCQQKVLMEINSVSVFISSTQQNTTAIAAVRVA